MALRNRARTHVPPSPDQRATRRARAAPLGGVLPQLILIAACAGYALGAVSGWGSRELALIMGDFGLSAAALLACTSCLWYAFTRAGEFWAAWLLFGLSSLMVSLGNAVWGWYEVVLKVPVPRTSLADLCFLLFAPFALVGLLLLAKRPVSRAGWICLGLDASLIGGSLLTLSWSVALAQTAHWQSDSVARAALALAYPVLDIALVSLVLVLHFRRTSPHRAAINTAIGALSLTVLCDALFVSPALHEQYVSGQLLDAGWFAGSLLLACAPWTSAAAVPSRTTGGHGRPGGLPRWSPTRPVASSLSSLAPYLAAAVCALSIVFTIVTQREVDRVVVLTACVVVLALVVRQGITLLENISLTQEIAHKESHFRSLVQGSSDVIMIAAPSGALRYVSPAADGVYGLNADALAGRQLSELIHPEDRERVQRELRRFRSPDGEAEASTRIECRIRHGAGHWLHVESSVNRHENGLILNSRDVTERIRLQAQLQHSASHDPLTDLPNRALFTERVRQATSGRRGGDFEAAVFYIDLDGFKEVNDTAGHQAGDELLVQAARRLRESVRAQDTVARLGGDEFAALLVGGIGGADDATRSPRVLEIAERIRAALSEPYRVAGGQIRTAASIGIAFADGSCDPAELLRRADLAMYRAKQAGKGRSELFIPQLHTTVAHRGELASRLEDALRDGEFTVLHQPVAELADGRVAALSAQARWRTAHSTLATPVEFLHAGSAPRASYGYGAVPEAGPSHPYAASQPARVGRWLLGQAVRQAADRWSAGHTLPVGVRVPARRLTDGSMDAAALAGLLADHSLPPQAFVVELTDAGPCLDPRGEALHRLTELHSLGVGITLDGYGMNTLPVGALHLLPLTEVRLARELVHGLPESPELRTTTAALLRLAAELGLRTTADGVDHPDQAAELRAMGCQRGQGAALSEPLDHSRLTRLLEAGQLTVPAPARRAATSGARAEQSAERSLIGSPRSAVQS